MATATLSSARSQYELEINSRVADARRRREALEELKRNSVEVDPDWEDDAIEEVEPFVIATEVGRRRGRLDRLRKAGVLLSDSWARGGEELAPLNVLFLTGEEEFVSAADAVEMSREDICKVEPVSYRVLRETLGEVSKRIGLK